MKVLNQSQSMVVARQGHHPVLVKGASKRFDAPWTPVSGRCSLRGTRQATSTLTLNVSATDVKVCVSMQLLPVYLRSPDCHISRLKTARR